MDTLKFTRNVKIEKYEVLMEIGRQEKREELYAVLMLAEEHRNLTPTDIAQALFPGRPDSVGKAIRDRCIDLELLDSWGDLTDIGKESLRTKNVFIPERGRYTLWYTQDPLIPQKLLHLEAQNEVPLQNSSYKQNESSSANTQELQYIHQRLNLPEGLPYKLLGSGEVILIRKIEDVGAKVGLNKNDRLTIKLEVNNNNHTRVTVSGRFEQILEAQQIEYSQAWRFALGPMAPLWNDYHNPPALQTRFEGLSETELITFKKTLTLENPQILQYGIFETTTIPNVPIIPKTESDAQLWAKNLLKRQILSYLTNEKLSELQEKCRSLFPDFPDLQITSRQELINDYKTEKNTDDRFPKEYWYLQTPLDLLDNSTPQNSELTGGV